MADLNRPFETRRSTVNRINSLGVKLHEYSVETLITGVGEVPMLIAFPVYFVERPSFTFGLAMDDNSAVVAGNFPTYSITVTAWDKLQKQGDNVGWFYRGAALVAVLTGDITQRAWATTTFTGKALRNPISGSTGLGL